MKILPKTMSEAVKLFKANGVVTPALIVRKFKLEFDGAKEICSTIEKRFPNLWRDGKEKFMKQYIGHR